MSGEKKEELVNVLIDGIPTSVPAGTNLIEAAKTIGTEIPYYCYHPGLSIAANCRMCLVQTNRHPPGKLVPGCQIPVAEGMEVTTQSELVKNQHRSVQEFLLLHHPVDCSICDQAGECKLQDYYMEHDFKPSRLDSAKWMKNKRRVLGPQIVLDQERCIMCTRCVRFMDEIAEEPVLGVFGRGTREVIDTFPGKVLDNNYSGNVVDLCPVGALLNRDTRFRARSYFLTATPSVCTGCSRGCNIYVDHFQEVPYRYRPRENPEVNQYWMCDIGRHSYHSLYEDRFIEAKVDGDAVNAREAARIAAERLSASNSVALVVSPVLSLEDALGVMQLAKEQLKVSDVYLSGRSAKEGDKLLLKEDRNPNRKGVELAAQGLGLKVRAFDELKKGKFDGVLLAGLEVPEADETFATWLEGAGQVVALATNDSPLLEKAAVALPLAVHAEGEGTFVNFEGRAQRFMPAYPAKGASKPAWFWAGAIFAELGEMKQWATAKDLWSDLSPSLPEGSLGDFDWNKTPKTHTKGVTPLSGGTVDGRPPGWRELIPLRTSGGSSAA